MKAMLLAFYVGSTGAISFWNDTSDDYKRGFCDGFNLVQEAWAKANHAIPLKMTCLEEKR